MYQIDDDGFVCVEIDRGFDREDMGKSSWLDCGTIPEDLITDEDSFDVIWNLHPKEHGKVVLYGKEMEIPRWQRSYGRDYKFSGAVSKGYPVPKELKPYVDYVNSLGYGKFNEFLLNWYQDGNHFISSHRDDETQLINNSPIITITLCLPGEPRKFRIRDKHTKAIVKDILTTNGVIFVMGGSFQKEFKHEIVKMTGKSAENAGARISITARQFK